MILIVSGPGYAGKSTLIGQNGAGIVTLPENHAVEYLASFAKQKKRPYDNMLLHYNTNTARKDNAAALALLAAVKAAAPNDTKAVVLVAPETELRERINFDSGRSGRSIPSIEEARAFISRPGALGRSVHNWIATLKGAGIDFKVVASTGGKCSEIGEDGIDAVINSRVTTTATSHSYGEIARIAAKGDFGTYHRVELPYGFHTSGKDVWQRFPLIFPDDLSGWSVLDVGCALGAFSFEAERRGAKQILAADLNASRLQQARVAADALGSKVKFTSDNFIDAVPPKQRFDLVLALNVLHHVPDPAAALKALAGLARKMLVLEFPNSTDPLYKGKRMRNLVGPVLIENADLFREIRIKTSPQEGRVFATCLARASAGG